MGLYMEKQKIENWKVLRSEYIAKEPWFTARRDEVQLPNGKVIPFYYVLEYPAWICVIALDQRRRDDHGKTIPARNRAG